jgi:predicted unusual protein kinase regulating ubiquinone biosynthesis (AarF/ABC1/UbiB family)
MMAPSALETDPQTAHAAIDLRRLAPADAARLVEIVFTLGRHGAIVASRRGPHLLLAPRRRAPKAVAVALRRSFTELGPTFIKLGQLVASSPGLFPTALSDEFRSLLDRVPPESTATARRIVERELQVPIEALFSHFDERPIASASIAQVHDATLHDGTRVAVKVRRPRLRRRIERDLRLLRLLAIALERAGAVGELANPVAIVEDFAATLSEELDFRNEARAMQAFAAQRRASRADLAVVVPSTIDGLVTQRVLIMTFIEGTPIDDERSLQRAGHDPEAILRTAVRAWIESALVHGEFHGDVHAGNLLVTPRGEVAFLDFGIVGSLDAATLAVLRTTLPAVLLGRDFEAAARAVFDLAAVGRPSASAADAAVDLEALITPQLGARLADISYAEVLGQVLRVATRYRVRLPREFVLVVKQLLYIERYSKALAPDLQVLADPSILAQLLGLNDEGDVPWP